MSRQPTHPGRMLAEVVLPASGLSKARRLGMSGQTVYQIINEKRGVTAEVGSRLGRLFGNGPQLWVDMQSAYDIWKVQKNLAAELEAIEPVSA